MTGGGRSEHGPPPILGLGERVLTPVAAADFPEAVLRLRNDKAAAEVGLESLSDADWVRHFGRFEPLPGNLERPLAMAYHGHQFRVYNPDIGDGRGFLFAQLKDRDGRLMDLGTKGSGRTPFSRSGDGRLTLKGAVREALATEMLEALGVPTSRTFSIVETGEALQRHDEPSPTRSAVLVRLSHGHVRFGTFQRLAALEDHEGLREVLAYAVTYFYPHLGQDDGSGFLRAVSERMAMMAARMMAAGFVHGVLNTDNMNVTGESFDYGPWRFAPVLDPGFTAAYFDHSGLYAFGRQPEAIYWNLAALGDALGPVSDTEALGRVLKGFPDLYGPAFAAAILRRLGVEEETSEAGQAFASDLFTFLHEKQLPFERAFFDLFGGLAGREKRERSPHAGTYRGADIVSRLDRMTPRAPERLEHPAFGEEPETLLIEEVEAIWSAIADGDDWTPFEEKIARIRHYGDAFGLSSKL